MSSWFLFFFHFPVIGNGLRTSSGRLMNNSPPSEKQMSNYVVLMVFTQPDNGAAVILSNLQPSHPKGEKKSLSGAGRGWITNKPPTLTPWSLTFTLSRVYRCLILLAGKSSDKLLIRWNNCLWEYVIWIWIVGIFLADWSLFHLSFFSLSANSNNKMNNLI